MNERIRELAKQAGLYDEKTPEEVPGFTASFEKFAELIVRECIEMSTGQNQYKLGFQLAKEFKEHFGVES